MNIYFASSRDFSLGNSCFPIKTPIWSTPISDIAFASSAFYVSYTCVKILEIRTSSIELNSFTIKINYMYVDSTQELKLIN